MAKKRKSDATRLDEVDRSMYTTFCSAANSLSQLYSQAMNHQRLSFQAGERHALVWFSSSFLILYIYIYLCISFWSDGVALLWPFDWLFRFFYLFIFLVVLFLGLFGCRENWKRIIKFGTLFLFGVLCLF